MPCVNVVNEIAITRSPRVLQCEARYDIPRSEQSSVSLDAELPYEERKWNVGLIVGPSGCGKSTIARRLFPSYGQTFEWSNDKAIVDDFPADMEVRDIISCLTSVGFSTIPAWLRPYRVLSVGEQFRAQMARTIAESQHEQIIVVDEFTSTVDRNVAQVASHSVQKAIRRADKQFVAVSCHYDIIDWLQPDWIYQPHERLFQWRCLQRHPELRLRIYKVDKSAWRMFKHHHYLTNEMHIAARCFGAFIDTGECVAFASCMYFPHPERKNIMRGHRLVVLPDYQGMGIGGRFDDMLGQYYYERGFRYHNIVAHPAMIAYYRNSPRWRMLHSGTQNGGGYSDNKSLARARMRGQTRIIESFLYIPAKEQRDA